MARFLGLSSRLQGLLLEKLNYLAHTLRRSLFERALLLYWPILAIVLLQSLILLTRLRISAFVLRRCCTFVDLRLVAPVRSGGAKSAILAHIFLALLLVLGSLAVVLRRPCSVLDVTQGWHHRLDIVGGSHSFGLSLLLAARWRRLRTTQTL